MSENPYPIDTIQDDDPPPNWLVQCLRLASHVEFGEAALAARRRDDPKFLNRSIEAARLGGQLARMRATVPVSRDPLLSVVEYLQRLAQAASVSLAPIIAWSGLDATSPTTAFSKSWARLAGLLGCERREALSRLRLSFLGVHQPDLLPVSVRLRGSDAGSRGKQEEVDAHLSDAIASLDASQRDELAGLEQQFLLAFDEASKT